MDNLLLSFAHFGQILVGFYFAFFGLWNIYHWVPLLRVMTEKRIPHPYLILAMGIAGQTTGGIMIMFNIFPKVAGLLLIPFLVIAAFIFHDFWTRSGEARRFSLNLFITNLTISLGALLLLLLSHT